MTKIDIAIQKYRQEGDLDHTYAPLKNLVEEDNSIVDFNTEELSIDLNNPLNIECQPSYDGTVNLIINDDKNPPRIINSRFTKIEDGRYRIINRNQRQQTNLYKRGKIDQQTRLFRNVNNIPRFDLIDIHRFGQLKGGNYTFYAKFADNDYNKTDIVAESGQISIFHGDEMKISSISGTLQDERTDKSIVLNLTNVDQSFSSVYLYYTREYSDTNGFRLTETVSLLKPYQIKGDVVQITITGFEQEQLISDSELNIQYNYVNNVKTQTQVQNMLFFGNVDTNVANNKELQNLSYFIEVSLNKSHESIGWIENDYKISENNNLSQVEYYSPRNIYYKVGYWPDEIYRLGVVYIMNDDSLSPVYNLRGCEFKKLGETNIHDPYLSLYKMVDKEKKIVYINKDEFIFNGQYLDNTMGVFKNTNITQTDTVYDHDNKLITPWFYKISFPTDVLSELKKFKVKGAFIVRQKRIPTILGQGLSIGVDTTSYIPTIWDNNFKNEDGSKGAYIAEGFLTDNKLLLDTFTRRQLGTKIKQSSGLLCLDACVSPILQSTIDGSDFTLQPIYENGNLIKNDRHFQVEYKNNNMGTNDGAVKSQLIFVNSDVPSKVINDLCFSTRAGSEEDIKQFGFFGKKDYEIDATNYVRGIYCPFLGTDSILKDNSIYNIKQKGFSSSYLKEYFKVRGYDQAPFYAISDRYSLDDLESLKLNVYRGDCYTNTVTFRINRNFIDSSVPINDIIVDSKTWKDNYEGFLKTPAEKWLKINKADINTMPLGTWVTYKCLSSYNLGLRAFDRSYVDEQALMGNPRGFYPVTGMSTRPSNKIEESWILNDGYNATVGRKDNIPAIDVPYIKDQFDNRIMFSNVQVDDDFKNAYRIFQGLSYQDIDRQYGGIVKLLPWSSGGEANILCIFEHGIGVVPVNQEALMTTTTGQSIHLYGAGVLQSKVSVVTPDFGSIWPESIIRTPIGVYGVDTYAKKIWRYTQSNGFETISDMKIQRFLNDNIKLKEEDKYPTIGLRNVKTHYNNYKGDLMFTFYNFTEGEEWNFCFNERMNKWITRYSWTPLCSENINNVFYSLDKKRAEILSYIYDNRTTSYGLRTTENEWKCIEKTNELSDTFKTELYTTGSQLTTDFILTINKVTSSYIKNGRETNLTLYDQSSEKPPFFTWNPVTKVLHWNKSDIESQWDIHIPLYYKFDVTVTPKLEEDITLTPYNETLCFVVDYNYDKDSYTELLGNGFYVHGRAGIFDEIDYEDDDPDNQIKPTKWYNKQEPFEFEFVVNEPVGLHKIFDNLVIISNKVEPKSIEFEVIGDVYNFKKAGLFKTGKGFKNTRVNYDPILNQYTLITEQECKNIENPEYGRRLGNIHYKEDSWYLTVEPIKFDSDFNYDPKDEETIPRKWNSARIRDKFAKIRVKYSGDSHVVITAIKNLYNLSNS